LHMQKQTRHKQTLLRYTANEDAEKAMIQFKHTQRSPLPGLKSRVNLNHDHQNLIGTPLRTKCLSYKVV
jgi:hypothetical protein